MSSTDRKPVHPGEILRHHYLIPRGLSQKCFADSIEVSEKHLSQIINGHRRLEPDVAVRIAKALDTTTVFWLNLQTAVDVWDAEQARMTWKPRVVFTPSHSGERYIKS